MMNKLADLMEKNIEELGYLETLDNGKPFTISKAVDIGLAIKTYRYYAGWCDKIHGSVIPLNSNHLCYTR